MLTAFTAPELITAEGRTAPGAIVCEDGAVLRAGSRASIELPPSARVQHFDDAVLAPGYIDLHVHGSAGHDVMSASGDGLRAMAAFLARHGVTSFLPTTVTAMESLLLESIRRLANEIENWPADPPLARPIGIHLEGPCISNARRGVHPAEHIRNPGLELLDRISDAARGKLRMITLAPELPGAVDVIRAAVSRGITVSIGHTDADVADVMAAMEAGASHATHTFNAMRPLAHRRPGAVGAVLDCAALSADIIADGVHVDPVAVDLFLRCKGRDHSVLITDAISAAGMPDGRYTLGSFEVTVRGLRCDFEGRLAGSVLTLDRAVQNVMHFSAWTLEDCVRLVTANPARVLRDSHLGRLDPGARADFVVLSPKGDVLATFIAGRSIS